MTTENRTTTTIANAADWHAAQAIKAYRKKKPDYEAYRRHIRISDNLRTLEFIP